MSERGPAQTYLTQPEIEMINRGQTEINPAHTLVRKLARNPKIAGAMITVAATPSLFTPAAPVIAAPPQQTTEQGVDGSTGLWTPPGTSPTHEMDGAATEGAAHQAVGAPPVDPPATSPTHDMDGAATEVPAYQTVGAPESSVSTATLAFGRDGAEAEIPSAPVNEQDNTALGVSPSRDAPSLAGAEGITSLTQPAETAVPTTVEVPDTVPTTVDVPDTVPTPVEVPDTVPTTVEVPDTVPAPVEVPVTQPVEVPVTPYRLLSRCQTQGRDRRADGSHRHPACRGARHPACRGARHTVPTTVEVPDTVPTTVEVPDTVPTTVEVPDRVEIGEPTEVTEVQQLELKTPAAVTAQIPSELPATQQAASTLPAPEDVAANEKKRARARVRLPSQDESVQDDPIEAAPRPPGTFPRAIAHRERIEATYDPDTGQYSARLVESSDPVVTQWDESAPERDERDVGSWTVLPGRDDVQANGSGRVTIPDNMRAALKRKAEETGETASATASLRYTHDLDTRNTSVSRKRPPADVMVQRALARNGAKPAGALAPKYQRALDRALERQENKSRNRKGGDTGGGATIPLNRGR